MKFGYQKEIDGLRAYAVLPVIIYHLTNEIAPNGYLGVDIFFVISGFVITKSLIGERAKFGTIRIINFFLRRFKRIYPALILMIILSSLILTFFGVINLNNYHLYIKTGLFAIFGISNIFLIYKSDDYFLNQENNPFTHTWSLGVEEQFYFIYPFLLFLFFKIFNNNKKYTKIYFIFSLVIILSLYLFFFDNSILSNFYSPIIRFWELILGCLAFFLYNENKNKISDVFIFFYIPILLFIYFYDLSFLSYQIKTFITVFLTFLFLLRKKNENFVFNYFLENKLIVYVGKISYSLYLWHLPVIYFANIYFQNEYFIVLSLIVTFLISHFSYNYVEIPVRKNKEFDNPIKIFLKAVPALIACFLLIIYFYGPVKSKNLVGDFVSDLFWKTQSLNYVNKEFNLGNRVEPNYFLNENDISEFCFIDNDKFDEKSFEFKEICSKIKNQNILFVLHGDCHAQHFTPMVDKSSIIENLLFVGDVALSTLSEECLISDKCNKREKVRKKYHDTAIKKINELSENFNEVVLVNKVFFTEKNKNMNLDNYENVMETYINKFDKKINIIFIEPTSVFEFGPASCVILDKNCEINLDKGIKYQKKMQRIYNDIAQDRENVFVFNPNKFLCSDLQCKIYDKKKDFLFYKDNDNLSVEASEFLSKHFDEWTLKNVFR